MEKLFIIDIATPFFKNVHKKSNITNWSKIPYSRLEKKGMPRKKTYRTIYREFKSYLHKVVNMGYNAVSFDDLCHIAVLSCYSETTLKRVKKYGKRLSPFFRLAKKYGMKVFITTDIMFYNNDIKRALQKKGVTEEKIFWEACTSLFQNFTEVDGLIMRFGERDGVDVKSAAVSKVFIKSASSLNRFLKGIIPLFKEHTKLCIVRTWTTGGYAIGDIMWNKKTFRRAFRKIPRDRLIISMKYGESDFFRFLSLSSLFYEPGFRKIIELQTRREYEGFGLFPSFVGWYYEKLRDEVVKTPGFCGISVWCQTGGWSSFRTYSFLNKRTFWNDLNTYVTIDIFKKNYSVEKSIRRFVEKKDRKKFYRFLKICEKLLNNVYYDPVFSKTPLYLYRSRVPVLLHVFWDTVFVSEVTSIVYRTYSSWNKEEQEEALRLLSYFPKLKKWASAMGLPYNAKIHKKIMEAVYLARCLLMQDNNDEEKKICHDRVACCRENLPHFQIQIPESDESKNSLFYFLIHLLIRKRKQYRMIDRIIFSYPLRVCYRLLFRLFKNKFPSVLNSRAMPIDELLG